MDKTLSHIISIIFILFQPLPKTAGRAGNCVGIRSMLMLIVMDLWPSYTTSCHQNFPADLSICHISIIQE